MTAPAEPARPSQLEDVSRWYGNVVAVNEISFELAPGITGLLGPNGAGKSTLLHMLAGFLRPSAGEVRSSASRPGGTPSIYRRVGLVPERESVYGFADRLRVRAPERAAAGPRRPPEATRSARSHEVD